MRDDPGNGDPERPEPAHVAQFIQVLDAGPGLPVVFISDGDPVKGPERVPFLPGCYLPDGTNIRAAAGQALLPGRFREDNTLAYQAAEHVPGTGFKGL